MLQKNSGLCIQQRHQLTRPKQLTIPLKTISIPPSHLEVTERYWAFFNEIATEIKAALQEYYEPDEYALTLKGSRANERPKKKHGRGLEPYSLSEKTDLDVALFYKSKDSVIPPHILIQSHIRGKTNIREQSSWGLLVVITLKKCKLKIDLCCLPIESIPSDELSSGPSVSPKPEASSSPASTSNTAEDEGETSLTGSADLSPELLHTIEKHIETAPVPTLAQYFIPPKSDDFESPGLLIRTENQKELIFNISEYLQASPADAVLPRYTKAIAFLFWVHLRNDSYKPHRGVLPVDLKVLNLICQLISRPEYPQLKSGAIFFIQLYYKRDAQKVHDFVEKYGLLRNLLLTPEPKDTAKRRPKTLDTSPSLPPKATVYLQNWSASAQRTCVEKESLV
ncbi:MAG: hypothetical protein EBX40_07830, partial [Gammaproteobacteria bacterium]|nr:hypothetical protein [Gammaproteobacteria bacterium]